MISECFSAGLYSGFSCSFEAQTSHHFHTDQNSAPRVYFVNNHFHEKFRLSIIEQSLVVVEMFKTRYRAATKLLVKARRCIFIDQIGRPGNMKNSDQQKRRRMVCFATCLLLNDTATPQELWLTFLLQIDWWKRLLHITRTCLKIDI